MGDFVRVDGSRELIDVAFAAVVTNHGPDVLSYGNASTGSEDSTHPTLGSTLAVGATTTFTGSEWVVSAGRSRLFVETVSEDVHTRVVRADDLGSSYHLDLAEYKSVLFVGTMTADPTVTITNMVAGATLTMIFVQNATGGWTPTLSDGVTSAQVTVNPTASTGTTIQTISDGTDSWVTSATVLGQLSGLTDVDLASAAVDGSVLTYDAANTRWKGTEPSALDPKTFGAVGDGATLDDTPLAAAFTAAVARGVPVAITRPYLISSTLAVTADVTGTAHGSIKKNNSFNGYALNIATDNIALIGPWTVECNRAGGALGGGVDWHNVGGLMRDVIVKSSKGAGVVSESGASLDCHNVESYDHITGGGGDGFVAQSGGRLRTYDCNSHDNDRNGYYFRSGCLAGCHLDGRSSQNALAGAACVGADGTIGVFRSRQDTKYGLALGFPNAATTSDWKGGLVLCVDTGKGYTRFDTTVIADQTAGTAVEAFGATDCSITTIVAHRPLGYGLALAKEPTSGTATSKCQFGSVLVDRMAASDSDPAVSLTGGANANHIELVVARSTTMAVSLGEGVTPATNDNNSFGRVVAWNCDHQVVQINGGSNNRFGSVVSRDCYTNMPTYPALLYFNAASATVANNTVREFSHRTINNAAPNALFLEANGATGNTGELTAPGRRLRGTAPSGAVGHTFPRTQRMDGSTVTLVSGTMQLCLLEPIPGGQPLTAASAMTGSTAGATLTHAWMALLDSSLNILALSADNTNANWAVDTVRTFTFSSVYTPSADLIGAYMGLVAVGGTMPALQGIFLSRAPFAFVTPYLTGLSAGAAGAGTGLTTPASLTSNPGAASAGLTHAPFIWLT